MFIHNLTNYTIREEKVSSIRSECMFPFMSNYVTLRRKNKREKEWK